MTILRYSNRRNLRMSVHETYLSGEAFYHEDSYIGDTIFET